MQAHDLTNCPPNWRLTNSVLQGGEQTNVKAIKGFSPSNKIETMVKVITRL